MSTRITSFIGVSTGTLRTNIRVMLDEQEKFIKKLAADPQADDDDRRLAQTDYEWLRKIRSVL